MKVLIYSLLFICFLSGCNSTTYRETPIEKKEQIIENKQIVPEEVLRIKSYNNTTVEEAYLLFNKISTYANKYSISTKMAFVIINAESDFYINAYNKSGNAYGLCQVTLPCLTEYNWYHNTKYSLEDMYNVDLNLEVGLWYYNRLLTHYSKFDKFGITLDTEEKAYRDCYIAYNIGVTMFSTLKTEGRNLLRKGYYPRNMYGCKKGEKYNPILRYYEIANIWN